VEGEAATGTPANESNANVVSVREDGLIGVFTREDRCIFHPLPLPLLPLLPLPLPRAWRTTDPRCTATEDGDVAARSACWCCCCNNAITVPSAATKLGASSVGDRGLPGTVSTPECDTGEATSGGGGDDTAGADGALELRLALRNKGGMPDVPDGEDSRLAPLACGGGRPE
jgi:hypothetical protein